MANKKPHYDQFCGALMVPKQDGDGLDIITCAYFRWPVGVPTSAAAHDDGLDLQWEYRKMCMEHGLIYG